LAHKLEGIPLKRPRMLDRKADTETAHRRRCEEESFES